MAPAQLTALGYGTLGFLVLLLVAGLPRYLVMRDPRRLVREAAVALYGCLLIAVVLLPLPGPDTPRLTQELQPVPLQWVADVARETHEHFWATPAWRGMCLNIALFVPLGLLLRRLPRRRALWLGFAASLTIELTQLTANWGTAPFVYRIFDVDDLITNTAGTLVGWSIATLLVRQTRQAATPQRIAVKTSSTTAAT
jgi:glycopeptide antibiotics resistance protein